jgi:hypothetical protein
MEILLGAALFVAYNIQGIVVVDSDAVINAPVSVQLLKGAAVPLDVVNTTQAGTFTFQDVPAGIYYLRVQHTGFDDVFQQLEVPVASPSLVISLHKRSSPEHSDEDPALGDRYRVSVRQLAIPHNAIRHYEKALLDLKEDKTDAAIRHLQRATDLAPSFLEAAYQLNEVFYKLERYAEAEQLLQQTIVAVPDEQRLRLALARVLVRERKYQDALQQVDTYLQSNTADNDRARIEKFRAKLSRHVAN